MSAEKLEAKSGTLNTGFRDREAFALELTMDFIVRDNRDAGGDVEIVRSHILNDNDLLFNHRHVECFTETGVEAFFFFVEMMYSFER